MIQAQVIVELPQQQRVHRCTLLSYADGYQERAPRNVQAPGYSTSASGRDPANFLQLVLWSPSAQSLHALVVSHQRDLNTAHLPFLALKATIKNLRGLYERQNAGRWGKGHTDMHSWQRIKRCRGPTSFSRPKSGHLYQAHASRHPDLPGRSRSAVPNLIGPSSIPMSSPILSHTFKPAAINGDRVAS